MKLVLSAAIIITCFIIIGCSPKTPEKTSSQNNATESGIDSEKATVPNEVAVADTSTQVKASAPNFNILVGNWMRMDGNYELRLSNLAANGTLKAEYFNPNPINVESMGWEFTNNYLYVLVKLQDVNYPGSKYTLQYFPEADKLAGVYFQAMEGNNYDVVFERKK